MLGKYFSVVQKYMGDLSGTCFIKQQELLGEGDGKEGPIHKYLY